MRAWIPSMPGIGWAVVLTAFGALATGCGQPASITGPTEGPLRLTNLSVQGRVNQLNGWHVYEPIATIQETTGLVGARVTSVRVGSPATTAGFDSDYSDERCWEPKVIRVEAGGTLDLFAWEVLGYCAPLAGGPAPLPYISLSVTFVDDRGHAGTVATQIPIAD